MTVRGPIFDKTGIQIAEYLLDDDQVHLTAHRWCLVIVTHGGARVERCQRDEDGRLILMHRAVMGCTHRDGILIDHVNRNVLDNHRANLRKATRSQNAQNREAIKKDGLPRGVTPKRGRWCARATLNYKTHHIGYFATPEEADLAVKAWRAEHMPFAEEGAS